MNHNEKRLRIRNKRILKRRYEGISVTELARRFGLTPTTIRRVLSEIDPFYGKDVPKQLVKRQLKRWFTPDRRREIVEKYGNVPNPTKLSQDYGISRTLSVSVVSLMRNRYESKKTNRDRCEQAKRMFAAGATKRFIIRRLGLSRRAINKALDE